MSDEPKDEALERLLSERLVHNPNAEACIMRNVSASLRAEPKAVPVERSSAGFYFRLAVVAAVVLAATLGLFALFLERGRTGTDGRKQAEKTAAPEAGERDVNTASLPIAEEVRAGETTWEGYLYEGEDGSIRVGWNLPYICQIAGSWSKSIPSQYASSLRPCASTCKDDLFMWVHSGLPASDAPAAAFAGVPRYLVRLHGSLASKNPDAESNDSGTMLNPRLSEVEYLSEEWLRRWGELVATGYYPKMESLQHPPPERTEAENAQLAPKVLNALLAMRKASALTDESRATLRRLAPSARAVNLFQRGVEFEAQRWLFAADARLKLGLNGLAALGPPVPDQKTLDEWFRSAESKEAFFENVREHWKDNLEYIALGYYSDAKDGGTAWSYDRLDRLQRTWNEESFRANRDATRRAHAENLKEEEQRNPPTAAQAVTEIEIRGNRRVTNEKILELIQTRVGKPFNKKTWDDDWHRLTDSGDFLNVRTTPAITTPGGVMLVLDLVEPGTISEIEFSGNKSISADALNKVIKSLKGGLYQRGQAHLDARAIEKLYHDSKFPDTLASFNVDVLSKHKQLVAGKEQDVIDEIKLIFSIQENVARPRQQMDAPAPQSRETQGSGAPFYGEASNGVALAIQMNLSRLGQVDAGKPLRLTITVKNTSTNALKLPHAGLWPAYLRFVVKNAEGKELTLTETGKKALDPKETARGKIGPPELPLPTNSTISSFGGNDLAELFDLSKPGRYTVQVIYEETDGEGWHGKAASNTVEFEVAK